MIDIEELKSQIVEALMPLKPDKIILFGSYAYGTPNEDSDLDICIVEKDYGNKWDEKAKIRGLLSGIRVSKDILNPRLDEYEFYKKEYGSVYKDIEDKGVVLWSS
ncbi:MAG: nucleotidyltransferase domain-containing protein [Sulfurimonas sp.]|nr:nucleotidyltransferase domain-containing protein [Sulfurimonas sp.]